MSLIKNLLVAAHRSQDWEMAKVLSQENERLKRIAGKKAYCQWPECGLRLRKVSKFCYMHFIMNRYYQKALKIAALCIGIVGLALGSVAAQTAVPLKFVWNNPLVTDPGASNLTYRLYATTNLSLPTNQWQVILLAGNVFTNTPTTLCSTNSFVYNNWFFYMTWTNSMWKAESFFSNQAVPDRLPGNFLNFNLNLSPTP